MQKRISISIGTWKINDPIYILFLYYKLLKIFEGSKRKSFSGHRNQFAEKIYKSIFYVVLNLVLLHFWLFRIWTVIVLHRKSLHAVKIHFMRHTLYDVNHSWNNALKYFSLPGPSIFEESCLARHLKNKQMLFILLK